MQPSNSCSITSIFVQNKGPFNTLQGAQFTVYAPVKMRSRWGLALVFQYVLPVCITTLHLQLGGLHATNNKYIMIHMLVQSKGQPLHYVVQHALLYKPMKIKI